MIDAEKKSRLYHGASYLLPDPGGEVVRELLDEAVLLRAALTKAVSLPMGQLPHEAGRYYTTWINGQVVVTPEGK